MAPRRKPKSSISWRLGSGRRSGLNVRSLRNFLNRLGRHLEAAGLRCGCIDVTLTGDHETARLNRRFRHRNAPADVLSFRWQDEADAPAERAPQHAEVADFLGDIVVSVESARRNAARDKHSLPTELEQLILHGALHLMGCDHETDHGEMNALELKLRQELKIEGFGHRAGGARPSTANK